MKRGTEAGQFLRDIVYGVNDALLTNVGIVAGFTASLQQKRFIFLAAIIDLLISAFSMGFGSYMSRTSELAFLDKRMGLDKSAEVASAEGSPILAAVVMWFVYAISGALPLIPFLFLDDPNEIVIASITIAIITFIALGAFKARVTSGSYRRDITQFFIFGAVAASIGYGIGLMGNRFIH